MTTPRRAVALTVATIVTAGLTQLVPTTASVGTIAAPTAPARGADRTLDRTLGNGLGRLLAQDQPETRSAPGLGGGLEIDQEALAIRDDEGRVLVQVGAAEGTEGADLAALRRTASDLGFVETADDETTGVLEGFVPLGSVQDLAALPDVATVAQVPRPVTHRGRTTFQGVPFQGVNRVLRRGVDGAGITVGVLSDSYDTATKAVSGGPIATRARDDVRSGDLPGRGNPDGDIRPVVVLEDYDQPDASDEGRAMLQIIHDAAPKARLCFATAFTGEVGFADNIRALADPEGTCRADVVVDDIGYFSSPFFSDDVISAAVEDVVASGVSYFSSAGNSGNQNAWRSRVDLVPRAGVPAAARRAGIDLSDVPRRLYAGGLQDMNPQRGTDVAQRLRLDPEGGLLNLQWSDPVDPDGPEVGEPVLSRSGRLTAATSEDGVDVVFRPGPDLVGQKVVVTADGVPSGTTDLVLAVTAPDGRRYGPVDTGTSPETVAFTVRERGRHTITVSGFQGARGRFTVEAAPVVAPSETTTDFAALLFSRQGDFLGAVDEDNRTTGRPGELADIALSDTYSTAQLVIGRVSTGATPVQEIGYVNNGGLYTDEYYSPAAPAIYGHPAARGAVAVAAMDPFGPYLPESYTSPGGALRYYFDAEGNRLTEPQVRRKPDVTSSDAGNTTFFVADDPRDADRFPNFGGTSAAAPMAAAIAALMLDEAGGPGSLSPAQVGDTMRRTAFRQDLDPFRASGSAGGVTVSAKGFDGYESTTAFGSMRARNFFRIDYAGSSSLRSVILSARTASPTALGARPGAPSSGLVFDPRPSGRPGQYAKGGFPFTRGVMTGGVPPSSVTGRPLDRVGSTPFFRRLRVSFARPLTAGQGVRFGIDRDLRRPGGDLGPAGGNSADEIGGAVRLPSNEGSEEGMRFVATFADGERVTGTVRNRLGTGFTAVGGWGPVDAYSAVFGVD